MAAGRSTSRGTPRPATKTRAPPSMTAWTPASTWPGRAVSRSTPKGFDVCPHGRHLLDQLVGPSSTRRACRSRRPRRRRRRAGGRTRHPCRRASPGARSRATRSVGCACRHCRDGGPVHPSGPGQRTSMAAGARVGRPVGARTGQEVAVPATGGEGDGAGLVLEQPPGEVAAGPVGLAPARGRRPARRRRDAAHAAERLDMRWSATSSSARRGVARSPPRGPTGPASTMASAASDAGEQRLADALAGQRVGGGGGVADEQGPARAEDGPVDPGRDGPRLVGRLGPGVRAEGLGDVGPGRAARPQCLHVPDAPVAVAQDRRSRRWPGRRGAGTTTRSRAGGRARTTPTAGGPRARSRVRSTGGRRATRRGSRASPAPSALRSGRPHAVGGDDVAAGHDRRAPSTSTTTRSGSVGLPRERVAVVPP